MDVIVISQWVQVYSPISCMISDLAGLSLWVPLLVWKWGDGASDQFSKSGIDSESG